ncbi:MAG: damage-inducible protein DinB [Crocinitomicaceae bacterium]|nr:damage-inducible protein DinB [Crocinitomicaceae bacterium]|tara:strand:- start:1437 stop:1892 length:456 start_codon:yes stop_codon:yes gene_type:complete
MKNFYKEMFAYHHEINQKIIDYLIQHEDRISDRCRFLISHSILANQLWNERMEGKPFIDPNVVHPLEQLKIMDKENFDKTIKLIDTKDFDETDSYKNAKGKAFKNTVAQILFQVANHFTHHRGQLMSELRSLGIRPLITDYIYVTRTSVEN